MEIDASLLAIFGIFCLTYLILRSFLFRPLERIIDQRENTVESARTDYESALAEADAKIDAQKGLLADARTEMADYRDGLRREAEGKRQDMLATAKAEADGEVAEAQVELETVVQTERATLQERARYIAQRMVDRLLRRTA